IDTDEEVRQLLDLKGLAAQRDLGNLKSQLHAAGATKPAAEAAMNTNSSTKGSNVHEPKNDMAPVPMEQKGDRSKAEEIKFAIPLE
ncbi:hypothetical protein SK128_019226, partial [Halocaridina rubra]